MCGPLLGSDGVIPSKPLCYSQGGCDVKIWRPQEATVHLADLAKTAGVQSTVNAAGPKFKSLRVLEALEALQGEGVRALTVCVGLQASQARR